MLRKIFTFGFLLLSAEAYSSDNYESLINKWKFECKEASYTYSGGYTTSELTSHLKEYTYRSLTQGLEKIKLVNNELHDEIVEELDKKIKISCKDHEGGVLGTANPFFGTLKIGNAGLSNFISALEQEVNTGFSATGDGMLFHEILHHAKIDNFPRSVHNSHATDKTADIVYACSSISFKTSLNSCVVCALAVKSSGKIKLNRSEESIERAKRKCLELSDDPYGSLEKSILVTSKMLDPKVYKNQKSSSRRYVGFSLPKNVSVSIDWSRFFGSSSKSNISSEACTQKYKQIYEDTEKVLEAEVDPEVIDIHLSIRSVAVKQVDIECISSLGKNKVLNIKKNLGLN